MGDLIPDHYSAGLSALDLEMIRAIPIGGNWKNIPHSIPSRRLDQIRESFARGEGSRSTYYGRLRPDAPSYTINTYFTRPGNGCHIHYDQDRVLSHREAARLQSFPDRFAFAGSRADVATQVGNAVPPLLAYQVAMQLGEPGVFVDLFAGAGGLALGFTWAGWKPLVANDISTRFLQTYADNVHRDVVPGDIREPGVADEVVLRTKAAYAEWASSRLIVLGGPPCQGFSTAGRMRSVDDERNHLFRDYRGLIDRLEPDLFLFENVPGLLNMDRGRVFEMICSILGERTSDLAVWTLRGEQFAVPQRRTRVFIVGTREVQAPAPPTPVTAYPKDSSDEAVTPSVAEAIGDLPALVAGQDGSLLRYVCEPRNPYQSLMRSRSSAAEFLGHYPTPTAKALSCSAQVQLQLVTQ
jgi:DNA (cytosine-5)-methyltransferase 1